MEVRHAVIAAAGMGTRLGLGFPKCLYKIGGKTLIHHLLNNLRDVEDVRVVVGFMEHEVMDEIRAVREDAIFVRNPSYKTTTTLNSYCMGSRYIEQPCLYFDADVLFSEASFDRFVRRAAEVGDAPLLGVTEAKTHDAVYVERDEEGRILGFSREVVTPWEWANIAWLPAGTLEDKPIAVFECLRRVLPMASECVESWEVDRPEDLALALEAYGSGRSGE